MHVYLCAWISIDRIHRLLSCCDCWLKVSRTAALQDAYSSAAVCQSNGCISALAQFPDSFMLSYAQEHGILRVVLLRMESKEPQPVPIGSGDSDKEDFVDVEDDRAAA